MKCDRCGMTIDLGVNLGRRLGDPYILCRPCAWVVRQERQQHAAFVTFAVWAAVAAAWLLLLLGGCRHLPGREFRWEAHGFDAGRVGAWIAFVEAESGERFGDFRLTVHGVPTTKTAWAPSLGRPVGVLAEGSEWAGMCAGTRGQRKSAMTRLAIGPDGFFPDAYGQHEMARALACHLYGSPTLPGAWRAWVPYWAP